MPGSLFDPAEYREIMARLDRLRPDLRPQWGAMSVGQMVCHLGDYFDVALGRVVARPAFPRWLQAIARPVVVRWPFRYPRGVRTLPELKRTNPGGFAEDLTRLRDAVTEFVSRRDFPTWPPNPVAGPVSGAEWAILAFAHVDHHLTQFGIHARKQLDALPRAAPRSSPAPSTYSEKSSHE